MKSQWLTNIGLGKMIASAYAVNGAKVYISGRREEVINATAKEINESVKKLGKSGSVSA